MQRKPLPEFEMRHRMELALEYGSVSVNEMAAHLGTSRTTISNYLHGRTQPRRGDLIAWCLRCGVPFDWLVGTDSEYMLNNPVRQPEPVKKKRVKKASGNKAAPPVKKSRARKPANASLAMTSLAAVLMSVAPPGGGSPVDDDPPRLRWSLAEPKVR